MDMMWLAAISSGSGSNEFSPSDISGLSLWLKADAITGLADGAAVATWSDSSGSGFDVTQGTAGSRPLYKTGIQNGLAVVRFDGTDDNLTNTSIALSQPGTVFLVCKRDPTGAFHMFDGNAGRWLIGADADTWIYFAGIVVDTADPQDTNWHIHAVIFNGASSAYRLDGTEISTGNAGADGLDDVIIGSGTAASNYMAGDFGEVMIYNSALSAANLAAVEAYLSSKWGI